MTFEAQWLGGPRDGAVETVPEGARTVTVVVQHPVMLNGQPLPGQYLAEEVTYPIVPGGPTGFRIIWHA